MEITITGGGEDLANLQPGDNLELDITVKSAENGTVQAELNKVEGGDEEDEMGMGEEPASEGDTSGETGGGRESGTDKPVAFLAMGLHAKGRNPK